jgi:hypothetical protein
VTGLPDKIVVNMNVPELRVSLIPINNDRSEEWETLRMQKYSFVNVEVTVHNRWTDVTTEVVPGFRTFYTLANGSIVIHNWQFKQISSFHGGSLQLRIHPLDWTSDIKPWESGLLTVVSNNLAKQRRKHHK